MVNDKIIIGSVFGVAGCLLIASLAFLYFLYKCCSPCFKKLLDCYDGPKQPTPNVDVDVERQAHGSTRSSQVKPDDRFVINQENDPNTNTNTRHIAISDSKLQALVSKVLSDKPVKLSSKELRVITQNYSEEIGRGGFGVVYKGNLTNGVHVAVKLIKKDVKRVANKQFLTELRTLGRTFHLNLVKLKGYCVEERALVYEYVENGSLDNYLYEGTEIGFATLYEIAVGTAKGLAYLHNDCDKTIVHYDIKPANILLTENFVPKVADFGIANLYDRDRSHFTWTSQKGTPLYSAPEMWDPLCEKLDRTCDVYSFGMVLFEIFGRRRIRDDRMPEEQRLYPQWVWRKVEAQQTDDLLSDAAIETKHREKARRMIKIALLCTQQKPKERPSMLKVVRMLEGEEEVPAPTDLPSFVESIDDLSSSVYYTTVSR